MKRFRVEGLRLGRNDTELRCLRKTLPARSGKGKIFKLFRSYHDVLETPLRLRRYSIFIQNSAFPRYKSFLTSCAPPHCKHNDPSKSQAVTTTRMSAAAQYQPIKAAAVGFCKVCGLLTSPPPSSPNPSHQ